MPARSVGRTGLARPIALRHFQRREEKSALARSVHSLDVEDRFA